MCHHDPDEGNEGLEHGVELPEQRAEPQVAQQHAAYQDPEQHHPAKSIEENYVTLHI